MRLLVLLLLAVSSLAHAETLTISGPAAVDDAALLDGEFAGWNFGGSPLLEAGLMGGIYAEHRGESLIQFDLRNVAGAQVTIAKLRLYKPKDFVQTAPVEVAIYAAKTSAWNEGDGFCEPQKGSVTREITIERGTQPLATSLAPDDRGTWLEFELPAEVVQRWIDAPETNNGVCVTVAKPSTAWGEHVFLHSSEHWSGNGPQLVIAYTGSSPLAASRPTTRPTLFRLPPEALLKPWLEKNARLAKFTKDGAMTPQQARLFQFYDTTVREQLIKGRYQVPLVNVMRELAPLVKDPKRNDEAIRARLRRMRELLLVWEYIRETCWYTSGPLADDLSPKQLGILFGRSIFGRMEEAANEKNNPIWQPIPPERLGRHVETMLKNTREKLKMSPEQFKPLEADLAEAERNENEHVAKFRADFDACRAMLDGGDVDEAKMFALVRSMHLNHELFLYYQSIYDTPRWVILMKHAPPAALAAWVVEARRGHYERQTGMSIGEKDDE